MVESGIGGSDESFISFCFAIVSVIVTIVYIPWVIRHVRSIIEYYTTPSKRQRMMNNPLEDMWKSIIYVPLVAAKILTEPSMLPVGARICIKEKHFFFTSLLPRFLRFIIRPKIFILWLWVVLFSSAMYITLTFDAHAILGVSTTASTGEIKKAYRMLSRRYHPDHNKTEEARLIYVQVRRAYKALVDREAFEEEEAKNTHEFTVGVALPRFLTSREHDGLVLFGLLGILVAVPVAIWYNFRDQGGISQQLRHIQRGRERLESFLKHLGIPEDQKYVERRDSRRYLVRLLVSLGMLPPNTDENASLNLPSYPDFITRCVEIDKNITFLRNFFDDSDIEVLHEYLVKNGVRLLDEYDAAHLGHHQGEGTLQLASPTEYKVISYFLFLHIEEIDKALEELLEKVGSGVPSARKLMNLHEEVRDLLHLVFEGDNKQVKNHIQKLTTVPQRANDIVDAMGPEIEAVYKKMYKNYLQMQVGSKNEKRLLKASLRRL
ncbi:chaperone protein DNAj, putative [Trypanosoma brucei gambiense DAL972]|uniref:Chaperone protein DNAj, putative n=1 Tax=Trypanosoma brucei gambiense (strain MHOM/CI/86/DAL972) TaxID=679716 RepID=C9ZYK3_TRYB9|nr:chaperone protein DNAj, putative [Trypanosoma brucei gambiense DAL972]CBH14502.1 chaperone protein DNAj, putative [Trypanosoma brucei gambiense DAL972]|eukprot:XP_011776768.1 chaperone protein DNAj, putative [Trypanosoma brucei gambiense DAL972]